MSAARPTELALVRQATQLGDPEAGLAAIVELRQRLETLEAAHVDEAVQAGWSWRRVALALGVTRQSAHARHARRGKRVQQGLVVAGRARQAVARAKHEAVRLGDDQVRTDHLLLGLLRDEGGPVIETLADCGITADAILATLPAPRGGGARRDPAVSPHTRAVLEQSMREAVSRGDARLDLEHLFLALLHEPNGRGLAAITTQGRSGKALERRLSRALRGQPASGSSPSD
jgi:Clp amino terminal domain, pathogenicity island component